MTSLAAQWLGLCAFTPVDTGLIPAWGTKILQAVLCGKKKKKKKGNGLMSPGVSGSLHVALPFSLGPAVLPAMQFASKAHAFPHTLLFCEVPLFPTAAAAGSSFGETACALKHVSVTLGKGWPDGVLFPAQPQFCVICRITTPLHNQGSRRRSRRWKSLSVGSMVGSEEELSSSVILTQV